MVMSWGITPSRAFTAAALCLSLLVLRGRQRSLALDEPIAPAQPNTRISNDQSVLAYNEEVDVVVASLSTENTSWYHDLFPQWQKQIYIVDDPTASLRVPENKGREAMVYLTYIIDRYDSLPSYSIFLHAERFQWHNDNPDYDGYTMLGNLQFPHLRQEGYVNLRCAWEPGCIPAIRLSEDPHTLSEEELTAREYREAFQELFPGARVPMVVGVSCCAQFALTRETIRRRSREEYVHFRAWLLGTELDDWVSGRVFEYSWHMIFGKTPIHCPHAGECYCKVYGLCELSCNKWGCESQYIPPKHWQFPEGWPLVDWDGKPRGLSGPH